MPKQLRGELRAIGPWSDTYALRVTLSEMLTQRLPHVAVDFAERLSSADAPALSARVCLQQGGLGLCVA